MTTEKDFLSVFMNNYILYCRSNDINISAVCRTLKTKGLNCYPQKLYNIKNKCYSGVMSVYTLVMLCNEINLSVLGVLTFCESEKQKHN